MVYAGRLKEATAILGQHIHIDWHDTFTKQSLLVKYAIEKNKKKIEQLVSGDFEKTVRSDLQTTYFASVMYVIAGMKDAALELLEHAVNNGSINYPLMSELDPNLEPIRGEERFKKLMIRAKHEWENFDA